MGDLISEIKAVADCRELVRRFWPTHFREKDNSLCFVHGDSNESLQVSRELAYCHGCQFKADAIDLFQRGANVTKAEAIRELARELGLGNGPSVKKDLQGRWTQLKRTPLSAEAVSYLEQKRALPGIVDVLSRAGLVGFAPQSQRYAASLVFPLTDWQRQGLLGVQYVPISGGDKKFSKGTPAKKAFFRMDGHGGDFLVITEGIVNALSVLVACKTVDVDVAAILGSEFTNKLKDMPGALNPVLFLDNDDAGRKATAKAIQIMGGKCRVVDWSLAPAGMNDVNDLLKAGHGDVIERMVRASRRVPTEEQRKPPTDTRTFSHQSFPFTDFGNAERFAAQHKEKVRFCHSWGKWLNWSGKHWEIDETGSIRQLAKETARKMYSDASQLDDDDARKQLVKHARSCESANKITAFLTLAQTETGIATKSSDFDNNPWLLNVSNGMLDLRSGKLRPHSREDLITKLLDVEYDLGAACPLWLTFLDLVMGGSEELILYMQKLTGYSLTGDTREKCLPVLYGTGDNGKTIFTATISGMLGDYAQETPVDSLMIKRGEAIPNDIARLKGARLVTASEGERGQRLAESLIKRLTGGDKISARFLHQEWFEFTPEFKIWLSTNHKPVIRGSDNAIWNRIHLIPFEVTIPKAEQIPRTVLLERLRGEWPGILRWGVEGCLLWQKEGLSKPDAVEQATDDYRSEMDILAGFLGDCCIINPLAKVKTNELYGAYTQWCEASREEPIRKNALVSILQERGFKASRIGHKGERGWQGIGLRSEKDADTLTPADAVLPIILNNKNTKGKNLKTPSPHVSVSAGVKCAKCHHFIFGDPPNLPGNCNSEHPLDGNRKQFPQVPHDCENFRPKVAGVSQ